MYIIFNFKFYQNVCNRLWAFERFPNRVLRGLDNAIIYTSNKEACLAACLNEVRFVCRSVEFNYLTLQCHLSEYDRRSPGAFPVDLVESQGVDYFENACLQSDDICQDQRAYDYAKLGMPLNKVAHYVELNYYPDKELLTGRKTGLLIGCIDDSVVQTSEDAIGKALESPQTIAHILCVQDIQ
ncbi:unnamed protein product [Medioppia subpectinata]|uniref:Apple domain-containing protein n=1 Tax=Medioppia subpectinata TaxID=1979941 RepID=A0A7R9KJS0_9ACAR|nr:unnamed protein product [Medioppia subpectinata]CAG2104688.1 unnamed protein product [Medioppia subpectinata]